MWIWFLLTHASDYRAWRYACQEETRPTAVFSQANLKAGVIPIETEHIGPGARRESARERECGHGCDSESKTLEHANGPPTPTRLLAQGRCSRPFGTPSGHLLFLSP